MPDRPVRVCPILKNREIRQVIKEGKSFVNQYFVVYVLPNEKSISKSGFAREEPPVVPYGATGSGAGQRNSSAC